MSFWEDLKDVFLQNQHDLPQTEERIRNSIFWDTGAVLVTVVGNVVGRVLAWCIVPLIVRPPRPERARISENEAACSPTRTGMSGCGRGVAAYAPIAPRSLIFRPNCIAP
jgi:hypothetical protein